MRDYQRKKLDRLISFLENGIINNESKELLNEIVLSGADAYSDNLEILTELKERDLLKFYVVPIDYYPSGVYLFNNKDEIDYIMGNNKYFDTIEDILTENSVECFFTRDEAILRFNQKK